MRWHRLDRSAAVAKLHSNASCGLSHKEARLRYRRDGANRLFDSKLGRSNSILRAVFTDPAVLLLLFACLFALCFSEVWEGLSALLCIGLGIGFGVRLWMIERRVNGDLEKLRRPTVCVLREGKPRRVGAQAVVRGDIVILHRGDIVPADCRLLEISADFRVLTLHPDSNGNAVRSPLSKNPTRVYAVGETANAPDLENMLYGGSEVTDGEAVAVVAEISDRTYLGAMRLFEIPQGFHGKGKDGHAQALRPYFKLYSLALFVLLIPTTLIGFLTVGEERGIVSLVLSIASLVAVGAFSILEMRFSAPAIELQNRFLRDRRSECRATIKSRNTADALATMTDLFVIGHTGISDGKAHLFRVATGKGVFALDDERLTDTLQSLSEVALLLCRAAGKNETLTEALPPLQTLTRELTEASSFDGEALDVRLSSFSAEKNADGEVTMQIETKQGSYGVFWANGASHLKKCGFYEDHGRVRYLEPSVKDELIAFAERAEANACRVLTVMRCCGGQWALLAVLALREEMQKILPSVVEELQRSGVRVCFFLREEDGFERGYADAAGLSERRIFATSVRQNGGILPDFLEKYRVFFGFSTDEIASAVRNLRKKGHRVGVIGARAEDLSAMHAASVAIAADATFSIADATFSIADAQHTDRDREDTVPEEAVLRHADLLIARACRAGGGLATMLEMISAFRAYRLRIPIAIRFLGTSQLTCLALVVFSLILGTGFMSGAQILYIGMISELILTAAILAVPIPQTRLRRAVGLDEQTVLSLLKSRGVWLSPLIATALAMLFVWILRLCDLVSPSAATSYLFVSAILLQITAFFLSLARGRVKQGGKTTLKLLAMLLLPMIPCILLSLFWQSADAVLMLGGWRWMTLIGLPLPPLAFLLSAIFLERTAT